MAEDIRQFPSKRMIVIALLVIILVAAFWIRHYTFYLPHDNGDQIFYIGLAMKLDNSGFAGYTLRGVEYVVEDNVLTFFPSERQRGVLLQGLIKSGVGYYDEPLYHVPYGLSYALMYSHKLLTPPGTPYATVVRRSPEKFFFTSEKDVRSQFYASVVPFTFSLLFILTVFFLGKVLFSDEVGLIAAALIAISPIDILTSGKIWAEDMLCFFFILSILLYLLARRKENIVYAILGGISCGIATITKQSGGFVAFIIILFHFWDRKEDLKPGRFTKFILDKYIIVFGVAALLVSFHWFYSVATTYGLPWSRPEAPGLQETVGWFKAVTSRPQYIYLLGIPYQIPFFILVYPALMYLFISKEKRSEKVFLAIWFMIWLLLFTFKFRGKEHRYMLPSYPAIAILSADYLYNRVLYSLRQRRPWWIGIGVAGGLIVLCGLWSVPIGLKPLIYNVALIRIPF